MKVTIKFKTDSSAFEDDFHGEVNRVLAQVQDTVSLYNYDFKFPMTGMLRDINGNIIGKIDIKR